MATQDRRKGLRAGTAGRLKFIRQHLDKSDTEIGRTLGITRQAVNLLRQRYEIAKPHTLRLRRQRRLAQMRKLKPLLTVDEVARQLGVTQATVEAYGRLMGYQFLNQDAKLHFRWRERLKALPPLLTIAEVARIFGLSYSHSAMLCQRHKYKATIRGGSRKGKRVPIRTYVRRPKHERWLASLNRVKV